MRHAVLALASAFTLLFSNAAGAVPVPIDRIVVVVNDGVVLQSELDRALKSSAAQLKQRGINPPPESVLRTQVLDRLITNRVIAQKATEAGIKIDDRELNEVMNNIAKQNGLTIAQFADSVRASGVDFLSVREQVRDEVINARVKQKEVDSRMAVTDQDINLYLANHKDSDDIQYRLSHILIAIPEAATAVQREASKKKAEAIAERVKKGEDFGELAAATSDGQQALQGGDLDWKKSADLPSIFASVAPKLKKGEVSEVLETSSGYHLIKLTDKRGADGDAKSVVETRARHILLMPNAIRNEDATLVEARELYARIQKGEKLEDLATKYSDDPGSKNSSGDLGFQATGTFVPEFQIRLDQLKIGEVSPPFHTQFGWHIARVEERRSRDISDDTRRARAREAIGARKSAEEYDIWLRRARDEAYIEIRKADGTAESATTS